MEQKRFGVKISRIEELRLFQLALQHKRLMSFETTANVSYGKDIVEKTVTASRRTLSITPTSPLIFRRLLPRQSLLRIGDLAIRLRISDLLSATIEFNTEEERLRFMRALGDLDPISSESDDDDDNAVGNPRNITNGPTF